ncbi:MAG: hypothetical protein LBR58_01700 [Propionibacteriaceae bacterium]|jgi:hypothetical protein|nr:hypothetical protein [Propionibacteriaceae bacterium]
MQWWGVWALLIVGVTIVAYGWLSDRVRAKREAAAIPDGGPQPAYITEVTPAEADLDPKRRAEIEGLLADAPQIDACLPDPSFVTDRPNAWAVLDRPVVLACSGRIELIRDLLPVVSKANAAQRPLVVLAAGFSTEVLRDLAANAATGTLRNLPLTVSEAELAKAAELTGSQVVPIADLHAGYLPDDTLGTATLWVSDAATSWVVAGEQG